MAAEMTAAERVQLSASARCIDTFLGAVEEPAADLADELAEGRPRYSYRPYADREALAAYARDARGGAQQLTGWEQQVRDAAWHCAARRGARSVPPSSLHSQPPPPPPPRPLFCAPDRL